MPGGNGRRGWSGNGTRLRFCAHNNPCSSAFPPGARAWCGRLALAGAALFWTQGSTRFTVGGTADFPYRCGQFEVQGTTVHRQVAREQTGVLVQIALVSRLVMDSGSA